MLYVQQQHILHAQNRNVCECIGRSVSLCTCSAAAAIIRCSSSVAHLYHAKTKYIKFAISITMPISQRVVMTDIMFYLYVKSPNPVKTNLVTGETVIKKKRGQESKQKSIHVAFWQELCHAG